MTNHIQVIDRVGARDHPGHDRGDLPRRVRSGRRDRLVSDLHLVRDQIGQARPLGQRHHWHQPGARHEILLIGADLSARPPMQQSHRECLPFHAITGLQQLGLSQVRRHFPRQRTEHRHPFIGGFRLRHRVRRWWVDGGRRDVRDVEPVDPRGMGPQVRRRGMGAHDQAGPGLNTRKAA